MFDSINTLWGFRWDLFTQYRPPLSQRNWTFRSVYNYFTERSIFLYKRRNERVIEKGIQNRWIRIRRDQVHLTVNIYSPMFICSSIVLVFSSCKPCVWWSITSSWKGVVSVLLWFTKRNLSATRLVKLYSTKTGLSSDLLRLQISVSILETFIPWFEVNTS